MKHLRSLQHSLPQLSGEFLEGDPSQAPHQPDAQEQKKRKAPPPADEPEQQISHPFQLKKMKIEDPEYMSEVPGHLQNKEIPGFPSVTLVIGKPGSGKTNLLMNLLTREDMWKGFFDKIYLMGPTVKSDKLFQHLHIPEDQVVVDKDEFIQKLKEWTSEQIRSVKSDPNSAMKCLFIFEDFTSYNKTVQKDPDFIKCFNAIRHHKASVYINIHKVKALERTARMSCQNIIIFPLNKTEIDALYEDYGPKNLDKKDFFLLCDEAWKADEMNKKPFLYINDFAPWDKRFRKCFTHVLDIKQFEGKGRDRKDQKDRERKDKFSNNKKTKKDAPQIQIGGRPMPSAKAPHPQTHGKPGKLEYPDTRWL